MTNWRIQEQANIEKYQKLGKLNQSQIIKVGNKAAHTGFIEAIIFIDNKNDHW